MSISRPNLDDRRALQIRIWRPAPKRNKDHGRSAPASRCYDSTPDSERLDQGLLGVCQSQMNLCLSQMEMLNRKDAEMTQVMAILEKTRASNEYLKSRVGSLSIRQLLDMIQDMALRISEMQAETEHNKIIKKPRIDEAICIILGRSEAASLRKCMLQSMHLQPKQRTYANDEEAIKAAGQILKQIYATASVRIHDASTQVMLGNSLSSTERKLLNCLADYVGMEIVEDFSEAN